MFRPPYTNKSNMHRQGGYTEHVNYQQRGPSFRSQAPYIYQRNNFPRPPLQSCASEHWCETCDRSFPTLDLLEKHKQQHQKCNIDGCQFIAHPKVITKHIQMQHATGLYKKIAHVNNPEEIKKWREERKKKYPTKENIEKKEAETKEKIDRGEKLGLQRNSFNKKNFNPGDGGKRKRNWPINQNQPQKRHKMTQHKNNNKSFNQNQKDILQHSNHTPSQNTHKRNHEAIVENPKKLQPFGGILDISMENSEEQDEDVQCDFEIDDDESTKTEVVPIISTSNVCGALSSLICNYESSDDETDKAIESRLIDATTNKLEKKIAFEPNLEQSLKLSTQSIKSSKVENSDDDSGPEEIKGVQKMDSDVIKNEDKSFPESTDKTMKKMHSNVTSRKSIKMAKPKVPSTLLQKLLQREIQQERNIVLQCIRHIVRNNFFENTT